MDLNEIREIIENDGGKFIIVENGKPVLVILGFKEYKERIKKENLTKIENTSFNSSLEPQAELEIKGSDPVPSDFADDDVNIDDLPLN